MIFLFNYLINKSHTKWRGSFLFVRGQGHAVSYFLILRLICLTRYFIIAWNLSDLLYQILWSVICAIQMKWANYLKVNPVLNTVDILTNIKAYTCTGIWNLKNKKVDFPLVLRWFKLLIFIYIFCILYIYIYAHISYRPTCQRHVLREITFNVNL